jgi:chromosome partitioning protein
MSDANEAAIEDHPNTGITEGPEVEAADQQSEPDNGHQVAAEEGTDTQRDDVVKPGSPFFDIPSFLTVAERCVAAAQSTVREHETREQRVLKRFSVAEVAEALNCNRNYLYKYLLDLDGAPTGVMRGRENTFSIDDIMKLRALNETRKTARPRNMLYWRKPGDKLPVITFCSQKGGTGKSLSAAHFCHGLSMTYGLRCALIDADPQGTCSLYFADDSIHVGNAFVDSFTDFMGVPPAPETTRIVHTDEDLNDFWKPTPWPGTKILPGGPSIMEGDLSLFSMTRSSNPADRRVWRYLRDALKRWSDIIPPRTDPADFVNEAGEWQEEVYQTALNETVDVIVIDTAPSLTLSQLNAVYAADMLVLPQTMKGFDLAALRTYLSSLNDYFEMTQNEPNADTFAEMKSFILPTMIPTSTDADIRSVGEIFSSNPEVISPIFYYRSDGASNAFREYKSVYEYQPDYNRKASISKFLANANAVNEAICKRALPHLPPRGYASAFIRENYNDGTLPSWTFEDVEISEDNV